jgi:hypothetical protein
MADKGYFINTRDTRTQVTKSSNSTQSHVGNTVRTVTTTPSGMVDTRVNDGTETTVASVVKGDTTETTTRDLVTTNDLTTTNNLSSSSTTTGTRANQSATIKFEIPIQQKNPVQLAT